MFFRPKELFLQAVLFLSLIGLVTFFARDQINQLGRIAFAQGASSIERTMKDLPPLPQEANLFYVSVDHPSLLTATSHEQSRAPVNVQRIHEWTPARKVSEPTPISVPHDGAFVADELFPSPDGTVIAMQVYYGIDPATWLLDLKDRGKPKLTLLTETGLTRFLGWHPNGEQVLVRASNIGVPDPGLWLVDVHDGSHQHIDIPDLVAPAGLLAAAFAPDGEQLIYATSKGIGFGSELWSANRNGAERRRLWQNDVTTVSNIVPSPDGEQIAFTNILDAPVPFAEAGLWTITRDGSELKQVGVMDGGRGQRPLWSHDSQQLFFVARENYDDRDADYQADKLVSSIRAVHVKSGEARVIAPADGARQIDLSLTPNGELIFSSNRASGNSAPDNDALELWHADSTGKLSQLSTDGESKRHVILLPSAVAGTNPAANNGNPQR